MTSKGLKLGLLGLDGLLVFCCHVHAKNSQPSNSYAIRRRFDFGNTVSCHFQPPAFAIHDIDMRALCVVQSYFPLAFLTRIPGKLEGKMFFEALCEHGK